MGGKKYAAMAAVLQAGPKMRLGAQSRPQQYVILQNQIANFAFPVPIFPELKVFLDLDG
jgi:hypothetical protein